MPVQPPKGTRDFYPEEMRLQNYIFDGWRKTALAFGFEEFEGPMFEHLELFTQKSGAEIVKQLYNFRDKGDRDLALRPELTPTLARMIAQKGTSLKRPIKWFSIPRLFRYERTQKGRLREFFQFNLDILGEPSVAAEAELVSAAAGMLKGFGLTPADFKIRVSSRQLVQAVLRSAGFDGEKMAAAYAVLDKRDKVEAPELEKMYQAAGISAKEVAVIDGLFRCDSLDAVEARFNDPGVRAAAADLKAFFSLTQSYGVAECVVFDPSVVRGLAYYTGVVFEIFDTGKNLRAIAGGGRYDQLIKQMGGPDMPAAGFGMGDVVLQELLKEKGRLPSLSKSVDAYIVNFDRESLGPAVETAALLRGGGFSAEFSLKPLAVGKQLEAAQHARYAIFVGGDEWKVGQVKIKSLKTGEEQTVAKSALVDFLRPKA